MKKMLTCLIGAALTLVVLPTGVAHATGVDTYVTVDTAHLPAGSSTLVQVPISYECEAGTFAQVGIVITDQDGDHATPGGGSMLASFYVPEVPLCTGDPQTYTIYLTDISLPLVAGPATYTATLYQAKTYVQYEAPGNTIWTSAPSLPMTLDDQYLNPPAVPDPVTGITSSSTTTSVTLAWTAPTDDGGQAVAGYAISCAGPPADTSMACGRWLLVDVPTVTFTGLITNQQYNFDIADFNSSGQSDVPVSVYTKSVTVPQDPGIVADFSDSSTSSTITLNWQAPAGDGGSPITGYLLSRDGSDTAGYGAYSTELSASARSFVLTKLTSGTPYDISVTAVNAVGQGPAQTDRVTTAQGPPAPTPTPTPTPTPPPTPPVPPTPPSPPVTPPPPNPTPAPPARERPLTCTASMSNARPRDYSMTYVEVQTSAHAHVTVSAHYRRTTTSSNAIANGLGRAAIPVRVARATPGRRVPVTLAVSFNGRTGSCTTSFAPRR